MSKEASVSMGIVVAGATPGLCTGCVKCHKVFSKGMWGIALNVNSQSFLVGQYPRLECCGEEVKAPFLFEDPDDAEAKMSEVIKKIEADGGNLTNFSFCEILPAVSTALN